MAEFVYYFSGREHENHRIDSDTVDEARNAAIRCLGAYLMENPDFAAEGHWRVNLETASGQRLLHVIVATVNARQTPLGRG